jgi:hypothetical protein
MLRFMEFTQKYIGTTQSAIADYFDSEISSVAEQCNISWSDTKNNLIDGKNKSPSVVGMEKKDKGRIYVWVEYAQSKVIDGQSFEYPIFTFKNYRNSMGEIGLKVNCLTEIFNEYEKYKATNTKPTKSKPTPRPDNRAELLEKNRLEVEKNIKFSIKEKNKFKALLPLSNSKAFSPYLAKKCVEDIAKDLSLDIRVGKDYFGYFTSIEFYNNQNQFGGLQRIYNDPISDDGLNKLTSKGFNPIGFYQLFGTENLDNEEIVYICEGLATALSILAATKRPVIVCLFADNIVPVSEAIKELNPNIVRVHVADNDNHTQDSGNAGVYQCSLAVKQHGGWVFIPNVTNGTDANDLHVTEGLGELQRQIKCKLNYFNGNFSNKVTGKFNYIFNMSA